MRLSTFLVPAMASLALAAPTYPTLNLKAALPSGAEDISDYFNMLANKVQALKHLSAEPVCDLSMARMITRESVVSQACSLLTVLASR